MKPKAKASVAGLVDELQRLQRQRVITMKSRNMQANRLQAVVAGTIGYHNGLSEKERAAKFKEASKYIDSVMGSDRATAVGTMDNTIRVTMLGVDAFNKQKKELEKLALKAAKQLPVAGWVARLEQRGFGLQFLAIVVGETGDLANYANPAKVWKRLGCAPWSFEGQTLMGATWRSGQQGKLPAIEWQNYAYSPRRRSIAYLIGEGLMKQNYKKEKAGDGVAETEIKHAGFSEDESALVTDEDNADDAGDCEGETECENARKVIWTGPYRQRYQDAKASFQANHPDYSPKRCHLHGMLLASKLLLKNLWVVWNGKPETKDWDGETRFVAERVPAVPV